MIYPRDRKFELGIVVGYTLRDLQSHSKLEAELVKRKGLGSETIPSESTVDSKVLYEPMKAWNQLLDPEAPCLPTNERICSPEAPDRPLQKLDVELAAFDRLLHAGGLVQHEGRHVAVHCGQILDSDLNEFRLGARVAPLARLEGPIAICYVATMAERAENDTEEESFTRFESPLPLNYADEACDQSEERP